MGMRDQKGTGWREGGGVGGREGGGGVGWRGRWYGGVRTGGGVKNLPTLRLFLGLSERVGFGGTNDDLG